MLRIKGFRTPHNTSVERRQPDMIVLIGSHRTNFIMRVLMKTLIELPSQIGRIYTASLRSDPEKPIRIVISRDHAGFQIAVKL